eukprot:TRINITY_DN14892_c0_g1_i9.p2 TRINITY_DN14892_c0_g1~~TRINITY_DN14892_c0_g1_i9.p2  ORF type:complete len:161 (+),score=47.27 TRINITY_DN14892_c0_g1_i9:352-834(+)
MAKRDQEPILTRELLKAKKTAGNILRNQVDAIHNVHFARKEFEANYNSAIESNEQAQKQHLALLNEYMKTKLEHKFALKKAETLRKMAPQLKEHYDAIRQLGKRAAEIRVQVPDVEPQPKGREERESSLSRESMSLGAYGTQSKHVVSVTDVLFEAAGLY